MKSIELSEIEKDKAKRMHLIHDGDRITLNQLCENFYDVCYSEGLDENTIYNYKLTFKNYLFVVIPSSIKVDKAFTTSNIDKFRIYLTKKELASKTINGKMAALKNLLKFAKKRKYITRDMADDAIDALQTVKETKKLNKNENFFVNGEEDVRKFIDSFNEEDSEWRVPILTLFYGALRIGEWQGIKRDCVNFENDTILITNQITAHGTLKSTTKNGYDRIIRLPHKFMEELKKYVEERHINDDEFIFAGSRTPYVGRHKIRDMVNKHLRLAGLNHITLHGLRHSFATRMFDKGYDLKEVQQHLGHTSMDTTMKYYIHYTKTKNKKDLDDLL